LPCISRRSAPKVNEARMIFSNEQLQTRRRHATKATPP
jgi:hypothetical protein